MIISTNKKLVVGLEIGTTKVITLVGEISIDNTINVIGIGLCASQGIDKGRINNLNAVVTCIKESIRQAEVMANCQITSVYLSLSSKYIHCQNEIGIVPIAEDEVTQEDIENVIHTAKSVEILNEHHILHVIPKEYSIDQQSGIKNPIGLSGTRMQVRTHLITCHQNITKNIIKAVEKCNIEVDQVVFSGLASSKAVLTEDDLKLGVCIADIGGGTIDCSIYIDGLIEDSYVIPYAGNIVTNDLSYAFSTSYSDSEKIKIKYNSIKHQMLGTSNNINSPDENNTFLNSFKIDTITEVIESRYVELFSLINNRIINVQKKLYKKGRKYQLSGGVVLTGGGAKIANITEHAEKVFHKKTRIANPLNISGLTNDIIDLNYSTVIGLLYYGKEFYLNHADKKKESSFFDKWLQKINKWFTKEF